MAFSRVLVLSLALQQVREHAGDWIDLLTSQLLHRCHARIKELLAEIRPQLANRIAMPPL